MPVPGIENVQYLRLVLDRVYRMKPGIGAKLQPTPRLLKLMRKNPRLIDRLNLSPMSFLPFKFVR